MIAPSRAPTINVATPKMEGIGHAAPREVSGTAPNAAPTTIPVAIEPMTTASALEYRRAADSSMMLGSYSAP